MGLKIGDYVKSRKDYPHYQQVGVVVDIVLDNHKRPYLYEVEWIKYKGWISSKEVRGILEKISEKEAVIEML